MTYLETCSSARSEQTLCWLPASDPPVNLEKLIASWRYLPYLAQTSDKDFLVKRYKNDLVHFAEEKEGSLTLCWADTKFGAFLGGIRRLSWDSEHFGFEIGALDPLISPAAVVISDEVAQAGESVIEACLSEARHRGLKHLSTPVAINDTVSQLCLQKAGFRLVDTLAGYHLTTAGLNISPTDSSIRVGVEADIEPLAAISAECFGNRELNINRFNSDPIFPPEKVRGLYDKWLRNCFAGKAADRVFVAEVDGRPVGFISCQLPTQLNRNNGLNIGTIPLNAVDPPFQGKGIYTKLVRAAINWLASERVDTIEIRTQLPNKAVHRAWQNLGARLELLYHRFHLTL